jgi:CRISPR-associated protein Cmr2
MKYIGVTIGPIFKTLSYARKTRELWACSYIFSYTMKKIIKKVMELDNGKGREFVIPYVDENDLVNENSTLGYNDRCIFESEDNDINEIKNIKEKVLKEIGEELFSSQYKISESDINRYLEEYFNISYVQYEEKGKNKGISCITKEINNQLDILELQTKYCHKEKFNVLLNVIRNFNKDGDTFLNKNLDEIKSIPEIASTEVINNIDDDKYKKSVSDYYGWLKNDYPINNFLNKKYHKYIAIVNCDGDNITSIIKKIHHKKDLQKFSKELSKFSIDASKIINDYGGLTIFAGGDDLLYFAPVYNNSSNIKDVKNIFSLLEKIRNEFNNIFEKEIKEIKKNNSTKEDKDKLKIPSISNGVSITYYKYPLYEALEKSRDLLYTAKSFNNQKKNSDAITLLKHSGKEASIIYHNDEKAYSNFKDIINNINQKEESKYNKILSSILHKYKKDKYLIECMANKDKDFFESRLRAYFDNNFNEPVHNNFTDYIDKICSLINEIYSYKIEENQTDESNYRVINILKLIQFFMEKEGENE